MKSAATGALLPWKSANNAPQGVPRTPPPPEGRFTRLAPLRTLVLRTEGGGRIYSSWHKVAAPQRAPSPYTPTHANMRTPAHPVGVKTVQLQGPPRSDTASALQTSVNSHLHGDPPAPHPHIPTLSRTSPPGTREERQGKPASPKLPPPRRVKQAPPKADPGTPLSPPSTPSTCPLRPWELPLPSTMRDKSFTGGDKGRDVGSKGIKR